ncbi:unnamed protein product [Cladocopium goreaui]|uniref:Werner syndrome ATP-dependent helicase-like n=1 Tax=Cladocopium goreaui TaxID=2562237 RepID=A0A9P1C5V9_9DINO|nr:unnamed protein product [Cladocopium goreaui]
MQFACWDTVLLLRVPNCSELPPWLTQFLESGDDVVKVTASFGVADKRKLQRSFNWDFDAKAVHTSYWDIAELAAAREIPQGMLKMAHHFEIPFQKRKDVGASDWESAGHKGLTAEQREYAANDAFFQLYLLGRLLQVPPLPEKKLLDSWDAISQKMEVSLKRVDNAEYYNKFMALRDVIRDAVDVLSRALGSDGCTNINELKQFKSVQAALKSMAPVQLNAHFLRQNSDVFVCFFRDGTLRVRLQSSESDEDVDGTETAEQDDATFLEKVQESLAAYRHPTGKKRKLGEPLWVPARAILTRAQVERFEKSPENSSIETSYDSEDGMLLRLARHPRAPDDLEYMDEHISKLSRNLDIDVEDAKQRLKSDEKFMQFWSLIRSVEVNSEEERAISRNLGARTQILADAHHLAKRLSSEVPEVSWQEAREGLEKVPWYRHLLGVYLSEGGDRNQDFEECFAAIVRVWPDVQSVQAKRKAKPETRPQWSVSRTLCRHALLFSAV